MAWPLFFFFFAKTFVFVVIVDIQTSGVGLTSSANFSTQGAERQKALQLILRASELPPVDKKRPCSSSLRCWKGRRRPTSSFECDQRLGNTVTTWSHLVMGRDLNLRESSMNVISLNTNCVKRKISE